MADTPDTVAVTVRIPVSLWREIRTEAAAEGKSAASWLREKLPVLVTAMRERRGG